MPVDYRLLGQWNRYAPLDILLAFTDEIFKPTEMHDSNGSVTSYSFKTKSGRWIRQTPISLSLDILKRIYEIWQRPTIRQDVARIRNAHCGHLPTFLDGDIMEAITVEGFHGEVQRSQQLERLGTSLADLLVQFRQSRQHSADAGQSAHDRSDGAS